jgi:sarcosine oxidase subunit beta
VTEADDVIVGAGVHGAAVAWGLARRGRDVLVLEANSVASGASGGPGRRGVRANGRDPRELPLARRATELWPRLSDALGGPTGYEQVGHLQLIEQASDLEDAQATVARQRRHGITTDLLGAAELRSLEPGVAARVVGAVYCPSDGVADHTATTGSLVAAARRHGAELLEGTTVSSVVVDGDRAVGVTTAERGEIGARRSVVLLCNTGVPALVEGRGPALPVFEVLPQVLLTDPVDPVPVRHLLGHASRPLAMKALPGGEVMITGGRLGRRDPATGRPVVDPGEVEANRADAAAVLPALADVPVASATAERAEAASVDLVPVIDRVPGATNALFATGWTGHGWAIAPAVAELLAAWVVEGRRPALLAPFGLDRFRDGGP